MTNIVTIDSSVTVAEGLHNDKQKFIVSYSDLHVSIHDSMKQLYHDLQWSNCAFIKSIVSHQGEKPGIYDRRINVAFENQYA